MKIWKISSNDDPPHYTGFDFNDVRETTAPVNWQEPDIQYLAIWDESKVKEFLGLPKTAIVYKSLIPICNLNEKLSEEDLEGDEDGGSYDWSELQNRKSNPPPIVVTRKVDGNIVINDGNHRVRFWSEQGYEEIPAWVYDELLTMYRQKRQ